MIDNHLQSRDNRSPGRLSGGRAPGAARAAISEPGLVIVGEADSAALALSLAQALESDVVLLDAEMPFLDMPTVVHALRDQDPSRGIVVITQHATALSNGLQGTPAVAAVGHGPGRGHPGEGRQRSAPS
jgi:CheY-like chemotaxis protein